MASFVWCFAINAQNPYDQVILNNAAEAAGRGDVESVVNTMSSWQPSGNSSDDEAMMYMLSTSLTLGLLLASQSDSEYSAHEEAEENQKLIKLILDETEK